MQGRLMLGWAALCALSSVAALDYVPDGTFNAGTHYLDTLSGAPERHYQGQRIARLPDGSVIIGALVPRRDFGGYAVGLVRYDADGIRQPWTNPGMYGAAAARFVIYDPPGSPLRKVHGINDLVVWGNRIFVLANVQIGNADNPLPQPPLISVGHAVDILVFGTDGAFLGSTQVMPPNFPTSYFAGGLALYVPDLTTSLPALHLVYAGTSFSTGNDWRADFVRYVVGNGASLTRVATRQPNPARLCAGEGRCDIREIALGGRSSPADPPRIYLAGSHSFGASPRDHFVIRVDANGTPVAGFGSGGAVRVDYPASSFDDDRGHALAVMHRVGTVNQDAIYVAGEITGLCSNRAGLAKIRANGTLDPAFGADGNGTVTWSIPGAAPEQTHCGPWIGGVRLRDSSGIVARDGKIALASQADYVMQPGESEPKSEALLTVFDAVSGARKANRLVPYRENGVRVRHSGTGALVADGLGRYTMTGHVRYFASAPPNLAGRREVATVRLVAENSLVDVND
ncbi:MAG: hypothetical protein AMXMBFR59_41900 [Rhodanobacteraceae bacterium]